MKKHNSEQMETIELFLTKEKTPLAYQNKFDELIDAGLTEDEAIDFLSTTPFVMEFYYSSGNGLFLVEADAVESADIFDPYTGIKMEEAEDIDSLPLMSNFCG